MRRFRRPRRTKGQAALEFLTTYGWAILIVLVMIGALSYFGVTDPKKYLPDKCLFKSGLDCTDFIALDNTGQLQLRFTITNGMGESIEISQLDVFSDGETVLDCDDDTSGNPSPWATPLVVSAGTSRAFTCDFISTPVVVGQSVKATATFTYQTLQGGVYNKIAAGELSTRVQ